MLDERDLEAAVAAGVLDSGMRDRLLAFARQARRSEAGPDEEAFRLLTGFNDIFVTIAIGLLLFAFSALGGGVAPALGPALVAAASWGLAEYFTRRRRMALPSIALLLAFVGSVFALGVTLFADVERRGSQGIGLLGIPSESATHLAAAAALAVAAAVAHWRRFMVPITVAAGAGALATFILALVSTVIAVPASILLILVLAAGLGIFALAMTFDARDRTRVTRWSDVAFWLHLLAAPMIIHPVFALSGLLRGTPGAGAALIAIGVYAALTVVALAIDRRALLVSALGYVIYAIQALVAAGGAVDMSVGVTALVIGLFLVLLSAAWRPIRSQLIALLPPNLRAILPQASP